jgi:hypothetical protein
MKIILKKYKRKTFYKKDLEMAFNAGRQRNFDTGVQTFNSFETWYKNKNNKNKKK